MIPRLICLLLSCVALRMEAQQAIAFLGPRASSGDSYACCPAAATYIATEDFEGSGAPANWTTAAGTPNYDYLVGALYGAHSLQLTNGARAYNQLWHSARDEVWYFFAWRRNITIDVSSVYVIVDATINPVLYINTVSAGGGAHYLQVYVPGTTPDSAQTTATVTDGNTYYVWVHYKKGTGADAICEVHFSTTLTKPANGSANHAIVTTGESTAQATGVWPYSEYTGTDWLFDKLRADDVEIGSDPT